MGSMGQERRKRSIGSTEPPYSRSCEGSRERDPDGGPLCDEVLPVFVKRCSSSYSWGLQFPSGAAVGRAPCPTTHKIVSLKPHFVAYDDTVHYSYSRALTRIVFVQHSMLKSMGWISCFFPNYLSYF